MSSATEPFGAPPDSPRFIEEQNSLPPMIAPPPQFSSFLRPVRHPLPGPVATSLFTPPSVEFKELLYSNSLILKNKLALFGQNRAPRHTHNDAQFCTIPPNRAQLTTDLRATPYRTGRKIMESRFPPSTARSSAILGLRPD
jgi:hypothetical protein